MSDLYYECFSGIAGDMHIAALLDLGVDEDALRAQLGRLPMAAEFTLTVEPGAKMGITGTHVRVSLAPDAARPVRHLKDVRAIIDAARLEPRVAEHAHRIFARVAEAEANVHGIALDAVHFHEVGATDSIVDIVAAAVCIAELDPTRIYCGPVELGGGMVRCEHGIFPVPAPATAEILAGVPCSYGRVDSEATTPTGAAILKASVNEFRAPPTFAVEHIGYGIGFKDFVVPNVLRASLGSSAARQPSTQGVQGSSTASYEYEDNIEIHCNLDDMSPEAVAPMLDALFEAGALDAFVAPVSMKKSRPALLLTVLLRDASTDAIAAVIFSHSTTIGLRMKSVRKWMLPRREESVATSLGTVRIKQSVDPTGLLRWKSEYDDVAALARTNGRPYLQVKQQIDREIHQHLAQVAEVDDGANETGNKT